MGALKDVNRDDLLNRFANHSFSETVIQGQTKVEFQHTDTIDSVTDSGGTARFNFASGPTVVKDQQVINSGFTTNTAYNGTHLITATDGTTYFEVSGISFGSNETGSMAALIQRAQNNLVDDAYKRIREALVGTPGEVMYALTPTQRDALTSPPVGINIQNKNNFGIEVYNSKWFPGNNWIQGTIKKTTTTDATQTTIDTLTLDDDSVYLVRASIVTIQSGGGALGGGEIECLAKRLSAGNAAIQGTVVDIIRRGTSGSLDFTFTVSGNDLLARVTGLAATTMKWESIVKYRKLSG